MRYVTAFFIFAVTVAMWWTFAYLLHLLPAVPLWMPLILGFSLLVPTYYAYVGVRWLLTEDDDPDDWFAA